ncbi:hypothetical protein HK100_007376, partial [Physocladia obscura]
AQAECTHGNLFRNYILQTVKISGNILDICGVLDRQKVYDILIELKKRNKSHHIYINQMAGNFKAVPVHETLILDEARSNLKTLWGQELTFRQSLKSIESLKDAGQLVDDMCDIFHSISIDGKAGERMLKVIEISTTLKEMCKTTEDRQKYLVATEIARVNNQHHVDRVLKDLDIRV